jgi:hypothetical protein
MSTRHAASVRFLRSLVVLLATAFPAFAQFQLYLVQDGNERIAPALYDLGLAHPGETASANFKLRNVSAAPAQVTTLAIAGTGFSLTAPSVPMTLQPQSAIDLTVTFRVFDTGSYSAALKSDGTVILLTATVLPRLTLTGSFDFGSVVRGSSRQQTYTLTNLTPLVIIVPAISVQGTDFALAGVPPQGQAFASQQSGSFSIVFTPHGSGPSQGTLVVGDRSYVLIGVGADPPLPRPFLTVDLRQVASAQQGAVVIRFDTPAKSSGTGSLALDFRGAADPTVAFASGGRTTTFHVAPGDTQATIPFQTGTTAGTLVFTAQLGGVGDQLSVVIPGAPAGVTGTQGQRAPSSVQVDVTGFDNTRTMSGVAFTFYDAGGNALPSGSIQTNAAGDFAKYFAESDLGGAFVLRAIFPVTGDTSRIASCDVALTNSAGITKAPRILF